MFNPGELVIPASFEASSAMFDRRLGLDPGDPRVVGYFKPNEVAIVISCSKRGTTVCVYCNGTFGWVARASVRRV